MKAFTKRQQQWAWFIGLWLAGLAAVSLLAGVVRLVMGMLVHS